MIHELQELQDYNNTCHHTKHEALIIADYLKCFAENNSDRLEEYSQLGPTIRHRVMNMNTYNHNLLFGFIHKELNSYNWLDSGKFEIEPIAFKSAKSTHDNRVEIGRSPNGKYSYGWHFNFGNAGSYSGASIYRQPINSRSEAFDIAINHAKEQYSKYLNADKSTYNQDLIKHVLASISLVKIQNVQTSLFL
jgi:hypothetical protein